MLGTLPQGLPHFAVPWITLDDLAPIIIGGMAVAMVSFADTSVLSRVYAARTGSTVDASQEMVGLGAANLAAGFFQGFPISSSSSRTPVAEAAGARTQLTGVVGAIAVGLLLLIAPDLLQYLPSSALAAVVIASALGLIEVEDLLRIYRIQRWEFWLSIVCFVGVAVLGVIPGIGVAIVIAVIEFLWDGWRPHSAVLGRADGVKGYHDITRYPGARQVPGLVLFRWDAPLFFANAEFFRERALDAVDHAPTPVKWLVVAAQPVTSVDVTAADALADLETILENRGVELHFAELKDPVKDKLRRFGLLAQFGEEVLLPDDRRRCERLRRNASRQLGGLGRPGGGLTRCSPSSCRRPGVPLLSVDVIQAPALPAPFRSPRQRPARLRPGKLSCSQLNRQRSTVIRFVARSPAASLSIVRFTIAPGFRSARLPMTTIKIRVSGVRVSVCSPPL